MERKITGRACPTCQRVCTDLITHKCAFSCARCARSFTRKRDRDCYKVFKWKFVRFMTDSLINLDLKLSVTPAVNARSVASTSPPRAISTVTLNPLIFAQKNRLKRSTAKCWRCSPLSTFQMWQKLHETRTLNTHAQCSHEETFVQRSKLRNWSCSALHATLWLSDVHRSKKTKKRFFHTLYEHHQMELSSQDLCAAFQWSIKSEKARNHASSQRISNDSWEGLSSALLARFWLIGC